MDDKIKKEEFNSTEIKIEDVESDISDDWELMSKFEAMQTESLQHDQQEENKRVVRDSDEVIKDKSFQLRHGQEKEKRAIDKCDQEIFQCEKEMERVKREFDQVMQVSSRNDQEIDRIERELDEFMQVVSQNEQEKDRLRKELDDIMQVVFQTEQEKDRLRKELDDIKQVVSPVEQEIDRFRKQLEEAMQDNAFTSRAARCSKPLIHAVEGESLAKAKVIHRECNEAFQQLFKVNALVPDKVATEAAKVDKLGKEKDVRVKKCSKDLELFQNEKLDNPSSGEKKQGNEGI